MVNTALATESLICLVTSAGLCKFSHGYSSHVHMCTHVLSLCVLRAWKTSYLSPLRQTLSYRWTPLVQDHGFGGKCLNPWRIVIDRGASPGQPLLPNHPSYAKQAFK